MLLAVLSIYLLTVATVQMSAWGQIAFIVAILLGVWWLFPEARQGIREFFEALGKAVRGG